MRLYGLLLSVSLGSAVVILLAGKGHESKDYVGEEDGWELVGTAQNGWQNSAVNWCKELNSDSISVRQGSHGESSAVCCEKSGDQMCFAPVGTRLYARTLKHGQR